MLAKGEISIVESVITAAWRSSAADRQYKGLQRCSSSILPFSLCRLSGGTVGCWGFGRRKDEGETGCYEEDT
jgi:hypothetical protein